MRLHSCAGCVARSPLHDTLASATAAAAFRASRQGDMSLLAAEHMISYAVDVNAVPQWSVASTFRRTRRAVSLSCASSSSSRSSRTTASRSTTVGLGVLLPATRLLKLTKLVGSRCRKPAAWSPVLPDPEHRMRRDVLKTACAAAHLAMHLATALLGSFLIYIRSMAMPLRRQVARSELTFV